MWLSLYMITYSKSAHNVLTSELSENVKRLKCETIIDSSLEAQSVRILKKQMSVKSLSQ